MLHIPEKKDRKPWGKKAKSCVEVKQMFINMDTMGILDHKEVKFWSCVSHGGLPEF